jgi:ribosomal protein S18 acetylase RimI-like enzyme
MRFREIKDEDIAQLIILRTMVKENRISIDEMLKMGITEAEVINRLHNGCKGWLCEINDSIAGFSIGSRTGGEMWVIAVLPEYEGKGIGRKLLELVQKWLFETNDKLWLQTEDNRNNRAFGFYLLMGWKRVKTDGIHCTFELQKKEAF